MEDIKKALQQCNTAGEMLKTIVDAFQLNAPLSPMHKTAFIAGLMMALNMIKAPRK